MSKSKKHNRVFRILSIILPLRKNCSVFPFKEHFLLSEGSLKLLLIQQKEFPNFPSASYFLLCFFPSVSRLCIPLHCRSFLFFSEWDKSSMSLSLLPVYLVAGPFSGRVLGLCATPQPSTEQQWLVERTGPRTWPSLGNRASRSFLPRARSLSDWPCTVSSLIGGLARSNSAVWLTVAAFSLLFIVFSSLESWGTTKGNSDPLQGIWRSGLQLFFPRAGRKCFK